MFLRPVGRDIKRRYMDKGSSRQRQTSTSKRSPAKRAASENRRGPPKTGRPAAAAAASGPTPPAGAPLERPGPEGGARDSNRRERIRSLLTAGLSLFLEEGIERVTIDQIAERAEMAKGGFYRYFRDK